MLAISRELLIPATGNNLGETEVFNAVRGGSPKGKLQIKTTVRPRHDRGKTEAKSGQNRGKWSHSFKRYCVPIRHKRKNLKHS